MEAPITTPKPNEPLRETLVVVADEASASGVYAALHATPSAPRPAGMALLGDDSAGDIVDRHNPTTALVCVSRARRGEAERVAAGLSARGVRVRWMPSITDALSGEGFTPRPARLRDADLAALVGRTPHPPDDGAIGGLCRGRRVLITGAGGSIGSELARLVASHEPQALALMDRSENALFEIDRELAARAAGVPRRAILQDVVEEAGTRRLIAQIKPHVVFHAAAHKHVPMMEDHPAHAITNNLFGAKAVADAALDAGAERFVLISTDKAVNPSSVMGATKRLTELYTRSLRSRGTRFSTVRFGNVLGSACSVIPIWSRQLEEGGPVTVTDARMTRYFMTIPEAASLVAQAAALDDAEADVFVLDMGEPVRILELAERFVRACGLRPTLLGEMLDPARAAAASGELLAHGGMGIVLTGARPGEKLHEELAYDAEELRPTSIPGVRAWRSPPLGGYEAARMIEELDEARSAIDPTEALSAIARWTPGFSGSRVCFGSVRVLSGAG